MTIQLRIAGNGTMHTQTTTTVQEAKTLAAGVGWLSDPSVRDFSTFVQVNDYHRRIVHEWDAEAGRWYEVEMAEEVRP